MNFSLLNIGFSCFDRVTHWQNMYGLDVTLAGCNLKCLGCQSQSQCRLSGKQYTPQKLGEKIILFFSLNKIKRVYIHGGETFIPGVEEVIELISILVDEGIYVSLESHGSYNLKQFFDYVNYYEDYFSFILKVPLYSTGMFEFFVSDNLVRLREKDSLVLKIRTEEDFSLAKELIFSFEKYPKIDFHVNRFGNNFAEKIVNDSELRNLDFSIKFI